MRVLLVEDSAIAASLLLEALRNSPLPVRMSVIGSGNHVLAYLRQQGEYRRAPRPDLILCSLPATTLHVPPVLYELDADPTLRVIPVMLLANTRNGIVARQQRDLGNVRIVPKPIGPNDYTLLIDDVVVWWQSTAVTPPTQIFFDRDTRRELLDGRGAVSFSTETRGTRNRARDRASIL